MRGILSELGLKRKTLQDQVSEEPALKTLNRVVGRAFCVWEVFSTQRREGAKTRKEEKENHENSKGVKVRKREQRRQVFGVSQKSGWHFELFRETNALKLRALEYRLLACVDQTTENDRRALGE